MKKIFFLLSLGFVCLFAQAQKDQHDSWTVKLNKKVILDAFKYGETANTRTIKSSDLDKKSSLEIIYHQGDPEQAKTWNRTFIFMDENEHELLRKDSTLHATISGSVLKKLFGDKKTIRIYTIALPTNLDIASRVRVSRLHLCTLELQ
jgi:hypothetical protein